MRNFNLLLFLFIIIFSTVVDAQNVMRVHNDDNIIYQQQTNSIDSIKFVNNNSVYYANDDNFSIQISGVDSITFAKNISKEIYIIYNELETTVVNPYADEGVIIKDNSGHISINSTIATSNLTYNILGKTSNGSLNIVSEKSVKLIMNHVTISNPTGSAVYLNVADKSTIHLSSGTVNTFSDGSSSKANAVLYSKNDLKITGAGTMNLNGYAKHGIKGDASLVVTSGILNIAKSSSDGINTKNFTQNGGFITIIPGSDGIDVTNLLEINDGDLTIDAKSDDVKGIKATSININGGTQNITVSGKQSKAIKSSGNTVFNGGATSITATGTVVLVASGSGYETSYCTAIKSDADVIVNDGNLAIVLSSSNSGGRGISADENVAINDGIVNISTAGNGATYTNEKGAKDSYTSACIKADGNISLLKGKITLVSTGTGGKNVSAGGLVIIGNEDANDALLKLSATTSGARFAVSGSGQNADYANPKAIKSLGNLTVNSGIITINCTQTTEGGEGLESKSSLFIKGGQITATTYDDCVNASNHIEISGGTHSFTASGNDGVDSNGTLTISGGLIISKGAGGPEEGFDCDNNTFKILGGSMVGTGGNTSTPTTSVSTQNSLKLSITPNQNICIKNSDGDIILMFALPELSSVGGGGGPGGGRFAGPGGSSGNKMVVLFSDPLFVNGTYTIQYGGTITGGTNINGYYTGGTYSGGSSKSFTVSSRYSTLSL